MAVRERLAPALVVVALRGHADHAEVVRQVHAASLREEDQPVADVLADRVDVMLDTATSSFPRIRSGQFRVLAVTAILGVLPIAFGMNIEFLSRELTVGAPATQWWISLSTAIVFGLGFATILTLIVTPSRSGPRSVAKAATGAATFEINLAKQA